MEPKAKTSYSCKLTAEQGDQLRRLLDSKGYSFREIPHALFAAQQEKLNEELGEIIRARAVTPPQENE